MSTHLSGYANGFLSELLDGRLVAGLGWTLLHFVWQGALIGCATAVLLTALRNARAETRYALACAALALCLAWPAADLALTLAAGDDAGARAHALAAAAAAGLVAVPADLIGRLQSQLPLLVVLWAACAGALGLRMAAGLVWIGHTAGATAVDPHWQARLSALARHCGLARDVRLRVVDALASPVTAGWWRPVVLVPASLLTGMDAPLLEALLAHELGHVKRHDYLVNLAQNVIEALLFYQPAVWWISRPHRQGDGEFELLALALRHGVDACRCAMGEPSFHELVVRCGARPGPGTFSPVRGVDRDRDVFERRIGWQELRDLERSR